MASKLPYTVEKTYTLKGQPYPSEQAALQAAVEQALGNPGGAARVLHAGPAAGACVRSGHGNATAGQGV